MKRFLSFSLLLLLSFGSFANCFGKFGLTKTIYGINAGINIGSGKIAKLFRTILMFIPFSFAYWGATLLDLILFNLVEFWTDSNPIAMSEYQFDGTLVKEFKEGEETVRLTYSRFGKEVQVDAIGKHTSVTFYAFQEKPGKIFKKVGSEFLEIRETEGPLPYLSTTPF
ncbi:DUF3332 family protein [Leptospira ryugenii]|nr:DUF3332 family protein [Leptospira ryugenii]